MTFQQFMDENRAQMIEDVMELVNIPSVLCEEDAGEGQPFGSQVRRGLEWILARAAAMGMKTKNVDGYAGEITIGDGNFMIGVLAHEDVVPAGDGWETDPFTAILKEERIYGRGSSDDKGPLISSLYAMKYLMDENLIPAGTCLRMIVGTNEEEAWGGINYYVDHVDKLPDYSIVPDGYFPLIFCEKGLLDMDFEIAADTGAKEKAVEITRLEGGSGRNVVPGKAEADLLCRGASAGEVAAVLEKAEGITITAENGVVHVQAQGKSTHAMSPEKGVNAISLLLEALGSLPCATSLDGFLRTYGQYIGRCFNGEQFGCDFEDSLSGKLTFNVGVIRLEDSHVALETNLRYPASMEKENVTKALETTSAEAGWMMTEKDYLPPVYTEPDSPLVKRLMEVYRNVTGDMENDAFAIGGATYARAIPNAVAYGPLFPYEEELAHEANECLALDSLEKMTKIYADALTALLDMGKESGR